MQPNRQTDSLFYLSTITKRKKENKNATENNTKIARYVDEEAAKNRKGYLFKLLPDVEFV